MEGEVLTTGSPGKSALLLKILSSSSFFLPPFLSVSPSFLFSFLTHLFRKPLALENPCTQTRTQETSESSEDVWKRGTKRDKAHGCRREGTGLTKPGGSSAFLTRSALDRAGSFPTHLVLKAVGCGLGSLHSGMGGPQAQSLQPSHLGPGTPLQTEAYVDTAFACCQSSLSP